jgi:hypothetical protein
VSLFRQSWLCFPIFDAHFGGAAKASDTPPMRTASHRGKRIAARVMNEGDTAGAEQE